jgi:hypothetical protein
MQDYTVWIQQADGRGTTYVTTVKARTAQSAGRKALRECAGEWGWNVDSLAILGIAKGNVELIEWND